MEDYISITDIICNKLSGDISDGCNKISGKISSSMIRVAVTRIFSNPAQSILELPVNSIDSYRRKNGISSSIGKFGMGFFSILYWLNDNRYLTITSNTEIDHYTAKIIRRGDEYLISILEEQPLQQDEERGTSVTIHTNGDRFTKMEIEEFRKQLNKLIDIDDVLIMLNNNILNPEQEDDTRDYNLDYVWLGVVNITLNKTIIQVEDHAEGIPLDILLNTLLIPSVSTKRIDLRSKNIEENSAPQLSSKDKTRYVPNEADESGEFAKHIFNITVGDIVVVELQEHSMDIAGRHILSMDISTKLPVCRDDILFNNELTVAIFTNRLRNLINDTIDKSRNIAGIFSLLDQYVKYTDQPIVYKIVQDVTTWIQGREDIILVPDRGQEEEIYKHLGLPVVYSSFYTITRTERLLLQYFHSNNIEVHTDIYEQKRLIIVDVPLREKIDNCGLVTILFVEKEYTTTANWKVNLPGIYKNCLLYRKIDGNENNLTNELVEFIRVSAEQYISNIYMKDLLTLYVAMETLLNKFIVDRKNIMELFVSIVSMIHRYESYNISDVREYIYGLTNYFSSIKIPVYYGYQKQFFKHFNILPYSGINGMFLEKILDKMSGTIESYSEFDMSQIMYDFGIDIDHVYSIETLNKIRSDTLDLALELSKSNFISLVSYTFADPVILDCINQYEYEEEDNEYGVDSGSYIEYEELIDITTEKRRSVKRFIISNYRNIPEIIYFNYVMIAFYMSDINNVKYFSVTVYRFLLDEIRRRYTEDQLTYGLMNNDFNQIVEILLTFVRICSQIDESDLQNIVDIPKFEFNFGVVFTCKQLLRRVYTDSSVSDAFNSNINNSISWLDADWNLYPPLTELQTLEIAVNEGTTKGYIPAILTELTQNSIDAIRSSNVDNKNIELSVGKFDDTDNMAISIRDYVGIPDQGILSLLIPFLSTKSTKDIETTGEMGSGFFNVYRYPYCNHVIVITSNSERTYKIIGTPIVQNNRVIDINYEIDVGPPLIINSGYGGTTNHTTITIILNKLDDQLTYSLITDVHFLFYSRLSLINGVKISLNSKIVEERKSILILDNDVGTIRYYGKNTFISLLMTNGIPFTELLPYIKSLTSNENYDMSEGHLSSEDIMEMETGIVVDVKKAFYTPVQSRNKIRLDDNVSDIITQFLENGLYLIITYMLVNKQTDKLYIDHYKSHSPIDQVHLSNKQYYPDYSYEGRSLSNVINTLILMMSYNNLSIRENLDNYFSHNINNNPPFHPLVKDFIYSWFSTKNKIPNIRLPKTEDTMRLDLTYNTLIDMLDSIVSIIWSIGLNLRDKELIPDILFTNPNPPKVIITERDRKANYSAAYYPMDHTIHFNPTYLRPETLNEFKRVFSEILNNIDDAWILISRSSLVTDYLGNGPSATILIHELNHAWNGQVHTGTAHSSRAIKIGGIEKVRTYDEECQDIYTLMIGEDLIVRIAEIFRK